MRDTAWFGEIVKRAPFLAVGLYVFLIGPTGQAPFLNLLVSEIGWRILCVFVGVLLMGWQAYLLWDSQRLPKTDLPIGQRAQNYIDKITLLSSATQTTELIARPDGLELNFVDHQHTSRSRRYLLPIDELKQAVKNGQITVSDRSDKGPKYGRVSVGRLKRWLYMRDMHTVSDKLRQDILALVDKIIH